MFLPRLTDIFTSSYLVTGCTSADTTLSVNIINSGVAVDQQVILSAGTSRNELTTAVLSADETSVIFGTLYEHDLITPSQVNDDQTLTISGFDSDDWDGEHDIGYVKNRMFFEINLPDGITTAPTLDGDQYLSASVDLGLQTVATLVDNNNFTIEITDVPSMPTGTVDGLEIIYGFRIAAAADIARAQAAYAKQNQDEAYLFVIPADVDVSKDRHAQSDAIATFTRQNLMKLTVLQNFSTVVFLPTKTDTSGANAANLAYGDIFTALLRTLYGYSFEDTETAANYATVSNGHGIGIYNSAFLTHVFDWQSSAVITIDNGFDMAIDVAFRDIEMSSFLNDDDYAEMSVSINLDDDPIE